MLGRLKELTQPPAALPVTSTSGLATAGLGSRRQRGLRTNVVAIPKGASWRQGKHNFPSLSSESPSQFFLASGSLSRGKAQLLLLLLPADGAGCGCYDLCRVCVLNHCRDREHLPSLWGQRGSPQRLRSHKFVT